MLQFDPNKVKRIIQVADAELSTCDSKTRLQWLWDLIRTGSEGELEERIKFLEHIRTRIEVTLPTPDGKPVRLAMLDVHSGVLGDKAHTTQSSCQSK